MDIVRGRTYTLAGLKTLKKLRCLTLRDLAGPRAGLDLSDLPTSKPQQALESSPLERPLQFLLPSWALGQ